MTYIDRGKRRFIVLMGLIFPPIFALLFFVTTMQRTYRLETLVDQDVRLRISTVSYLGRAHQKRIEACDLVADRWVGDWSIESDVKWYWVFDEGTRLLKIDGDNQLVVVDIRGRSQRLGPCPVDLDWRFDTRKFKFIDGGFLYARAKDSAPVYFDVSTGESTPLQPEGTASLSTRARPRVSWELVNENCLVVSCYERGKFVRGVYRLDGTKVAKIGQVLDPRTLSADGSWYARPHFALKPVRRRTHWEIVDTKADQILSTIDEPDLTLRVYDKSLMGFYNDFGDNSKRRSYSNAIKRFDPKTGEPIGEKIEFQSVHVSMLHANASRLYIYDPYIESSDLKIIDTDASRVIVHTIGPGLPWWWPLRIAGIALAAAWWLVWSLRMRRNRRSFQPLIDLTILHLALLVCFGVRLYGYLTGPDWIATLDDWESAGFLGTATSLLGLVLLWVIHSAAGLGVRLGAIVMSLIAIVSFSIYVWDVDPMRMEPSVDRMRTVVETGVSGATTLVLLGVAAMSGIRLIHRSDSIAEARRHRLGFSIRHMIFWTLTFAVLFVVLRSRTFESPGGSDLLNLAASGAAVGLGTTCVLWLGLGRSAWRYLIAFAGLVICGLLCRVTESDNAMRIGAMLVPLLLVSTFTLRWNGYSLRKPVVSSQQVSPVT